MSRRIAHFFVLSALIGLAACGNNDKSSAKNPQSAQGSGRCPLDSAYSEAEAFVCDLYNSIPAGSDSGSTHPFQDFAGHFFLPEDIELPESIEGVLYGAPYQSISDFRIEKNADPERGKVTVRYSNYGREETLVFFLQYFDEVWSVTDIRYTSGYNLRERLGAPPNEPPDPDLLGRYLKARKTLLETLEYDNVRYEAFQALKPRQRQMIVNKRHQAEAFVRAKIAALTGNRQLEGFARGPGNNLLSCAYDGCHGVDGVFYDGEGALSALLVPKPLMDLAKKEKLLGDGEYPDEFVNAFLSESFFTRLGTLPVTVPDSLGTVEVVVGVDGQDDPLGIPPTVVALQAIRDGVVYLLYDLLEGAEKIPACAQTVQNEARSYAECYAEQLPSQPFYPELLRQGQALADRLAKF